MSAGRAFGRVPTIAGVIAALALAFTLAVACGGGGGNAPASTPTSAPEPEPTVQGSAFIFPGRGYRVQIPDGWQSDANTLVAGPMKVDSFYSSGTVDGVQSNISVTCELNSAGVSTEDFLRNRLETVRQLGPKDLTDASAVTVGGVQADEISYTLTRGDVVLRKTDVMFVTARCAWTVSAVTAPSQEAQTRDIFNGFLSTFQFIDTGAS